MRIGIDAHMLGDHSGGNESLYSNLLRNMVIENEDTVFLFVKPEVDVTAYGKDFQIVRFEEANAFKRYFFELPRLCRKYQLDILHTQYFIPFNRPCPVVCSIHDICFEHYRDIFTKKEYLRQKLLIPYSARHSKRIIVCSEYSKLDISKRYHIPEDKIDVAYCAVNKDYRKLSAVEIDSTNLRRKFGIKKDYILSVGNLQPRKNLVRLIRAYQNLKETDEIEEQLVIVGKKAWMFNDILKEALNNSADIIFTDYVSENDLIRLYNDAEIFVYPSFFEGFGMPPLEAIACGTPVAVSDRTSLPEAVGEAGIYFNPFSVDEISESIKRLIEDRTLRESLIEHGYEQVRKFDWRKSAMIVMNAYKQIM